MAKAKTLSEVYQNADDPKSPALQKQLWDNADAVVAKRLAREKAKGSTTKESTGLSDKDEDYEF